MTVDAPRGRYAPSPTGLTHLGNARTALLAWLSVRSRSGTFVYRVEDIDGPRTVPGMVEAAIEDLRWLGLDWDEGPDVGGPHAPYVQSERSDIYERALERLSADGRLYPCRLSRKDLRDLASAPHGPVERADVYPAELRPQGWQDFRYRRDDVCDTSDAALRFTVEPGQVTFVDRVLGEIGEDVARTVGDFVLKRRDGLYAYQLAVVADDIAMGVDEIVRGADLVDSTARQIRLIDSLEGNRPMYAHPPLIVSATGEKLSKRDASLTLAALRAEGVRAQDVVGYLAYSSGLIDAAQSVSTQELVSDFDWARVAGQTWQLIEPLRLGGSHENSAR